jgi:hypothetical protein
MVQEPARGAAQSPRYERISAKIAVFGRFRDLSDQHLRNGGSIFETEGTKLRVFLRTKQRTPFRATRTRTFGRHRPQTKSADLAPVCAGAGMTGAVSDGFGKFSGDH